MFWLVLACSSSVPVIAPKGPPPPVPDRSAAEGVQPLEGVQRLFTGPFRCRIPDGTLVAFHPNGIARGEPAFRGSWSHVGQRLTVEARHHDTELTYEWSYVPYTHEGDWVLATTEGTIACRPGHEAEPGPVGPWVEVVDAGGDAPKAMRVLSNADVAFAVDGHRGDDVDGLVLHHRPGVASKALAQHLADGLGLSVRLVEDATLSGPFELHVGQ